MNMLEANSQLSRLANSAPAGEAVIIASHGTAPNEAFSEVVVQVRRLLIAQAQVEGLLAGLATGRWPGCPGSLQRA
ncbi:hypothetical protein CPCC7001_741 [Cyanobium sp. PCC 7001]|nr:hypothetical protein CPCC7001_741 [Cyanobium sp. PCC 7001]